MSVYIHSFLFLLQSPFVAAVKALFALMQMNPLYLPPVLIAVQLQLLLLILQPRPILLLLVLLLLT